jgi:poly-gamma-glutamate synthesis protein (capsule biosynthesis protein)
MAALAPAVLAPTLAFAVAGSPSGAGATTDRPAPRAVSRTLVLKAPPAVAAGIAIPLRGRGAKPGLRVALERRGRRGRWRLVAAPRADRRGRFRARFRPRGTRRRLVVLRARAGKRRRPAEVSPSRRVRVRHVVLAAVGDINLGNGVRYLMRSRGRRYPWRNVAPVLRGADIAFGNLECAISHRGRPVPKLYNFRGGPAALRVAGRLAGLDVLNLANNHSGDFGRRAFLDTIRFVRRFGMRPVGAGRSLRRARRPTVVRRLGLRIAFVGFSTLFPASFWAGPDRPGVPFASPANVRAGVRAARRRADLVIATFHWGIERSPFPDGIQRRLARAALHAGATAVIGAHPHVLQPIRHRGARGRRLVAYSLGNFVFIAASPATRSTGILQLSLSARGIERTRLRRATIVAGRPVLR